MGTTSVTSKVLTTSTIPCTARTISTTIPQRFIITMVGIMVATSAPIMIPGISSIITMSETLRLGQQIMEAGDTVAGVIILAIAGM